MRGAAAMVMLVLAVALAGGADRADAASAPAYRTAADRLCATANTRLSGLPRPRTAEAVRAWVLRAAPIISTSTRRIRALTPPPALRARHRVWGLALARRAATVRALRARVAAGSPPVAAFEAAVPRLTAQKRASRARARELRLRACSGRR